MNRYYINTLLTRKQPFLCPTDPQEMIVAIKTKLAQDQSHLKQAYHRSKLMWVICANNIGNNRHRTTSGVLIEGWFDTLEKCYRHLFGPNILTYSAEFYEHRKELLRLLGKIE